MWWNMGEEWRSGIVWDTQVAEVVIENSDESVNNTQLLIKHAVFGISVFECSFVIACGLT